MKEFQISPDVFYSVKIAENKYEKGELSSSDSFDPNRDVRNFDLEIKKEIGDKLSSSFRKGFNGDVDLVPLGLVEDILN